MTARFFCAALLCLPLAACTAPAAGPSATTHDPRESRLKTGEVSKSLNTGDWYVVDRTTTSVPRSEAIYPIALSEAGAALIVHSWPNGDRMPHQTLEYRDPKWKRERIPRAAHAGDRQIVGGALGKRFAVWKETESVDSVSDKWSIYSFDRKTRRLRLIASQDLAAPDGVPYAAPGGTVPTVGAGAAVYFSAVDYSASEQGVVNIFRASARTEDSAVAVERGLAAQVHGHFVYVLKETPHDFRVVRLASSDDRRKTLYRSTTDSKCNKVSGLQGNSLGQAALQLQCGRSVHLGLLKRGRLTSPTQVQTPRAGYLALTDDLLWYASASSDGGYIQHLHVLGTQGYKRVGKGSVSGECACSGDYFSWAKFKGDDATRLYAHLLAAN
jgi:hypothetical protein